MSDEKKSAAANATNSEGGRTLVLCFDGTANQFDETNTNIVHIFSLLAKEDPRQLVYYQTGVGTYIGPSVATPIGKGVSKWMDICMAWYLDAHVIDGYKFLQSNYVKGDRICLFGFSRGAYTARALAGMLYTIGLLPRSMPEQVEFAYRIFKTGKATAQYKRSFCRPVKISFIGVFDTVSSVGAIVPRVLPFSIDNHITKTFRHALALDERRAKFRSNTWHLVHPDVHLDKDGMPTGGGKMGFWDRLARRRGKESLEAEIAAEEREAAEAEGEVVEEVKTDVKEVWFAGGHCDVGGGNALDSEPYKLSNIALRWMLREAIHSDSGIIFDEHKLRKFGVPGTAYAPAPEKIPASRTGTAEEKSKSKIDGVNSPRKASDIRPRNAEGGMPQLPSVVPAPEGHAPASSEESPTSPTAVSADETGTTAHDSLDGTGEEIEVPWWYRDAIEPMRDELLHQPAWWLLELLPFYVKRQDEHSIWKKHVRVNAFRPRIIPHPPHPTNPNHPDHDHAHGANVHPHTFIHESVRTRMDAPEAYERTWRSMWMRRDRGYKPRAWPKAGSGEPVFVE